MMVYHYRDDLNLLTLLFQVKGDTPLHIAVRDQNIDMVRLLLERRDIDPDKVDKVHHYFVKLVQSTNKFNPTIDSIKLYKLYLYSKNVNRNLVQQI